MPCLPSISRLSNFSKSSLDTRILTKSLCHGSLMLLSWCATRSKFQGFLKSPTGWPSRDSVSVSVSAGMSPMSFGNPKKHSSSYRNPQVEASPAGGVACCSCMCLVISTTQASRTRAVSRFLMEVTSDASALPSQNNSRSLSARSREQSDRSMAFPTVRNSRTAVPTEWMTVVLARSTWSARMKLLLVLVSDRRL